MLPVKRLSVEGKETYIAGYQKSENDLEMIKLWSNKKTQTNNQQDKTEKENKKPPHTLVCKI